MNNFLKKNLLFRILAKSNINLIIYLIILVFIIIVTIKSHKEQDIENFISLTKYNNKNIKYSECKKNCYVKYEDPDKAKTCKKYCKCKKKCLYNKKCLKDCREIKKNIDRDDKEKYEKKTLQRELKKKDKKEMKKREIEELRKEREEKKLNNSSDDRKKSYLTSLINKYMSENDKLFLVEYNNGVKNFLKEGKSIFKF